MTLSAQILIKLNPVQIFPKDDETKRRMELTNVQRTNNWIQILRVNLGGEQVDAIIIHCRYDNCKINCVAKLHMEEEKEEEVLWLLIKEWEEVDGERETVQ